MLEDYAAMIRIAVGHVVPHVHAGQQFGDTGIQARPLDIEVHEAGVTAVQVEHFAERGDAALCTKAARVAELEALQLGPGEVAQVAHVTVRFEQTVQHVIVEDDQHVVLGRSNVDLIAVSPQLECRAKGLQRVLVGVLRGATVTDDIGPGATFSDPLMALLGFKLGFDRKCRGSSVGAPIPEPHEMARRRRLAMTYCIRCSPGESQRSVNFGILADQRFGVIPD